MLTDFSNIDDPVGRAVKKFENHPSILDIRRRNISISISINSLFAFSEVGAAEMLIEIKNLNDKKSGTFMNIPVKRFKEVGDIVADALAQIWNEEVIKNKKFAVELKVADITPLRKKVVRIHERDTMHNMR